MTSLGVAATLSPGVPAKGVDEEFGGGNVNGLGGLACCGKRAMTGNCRTTGRRDDGTTERRDDSGPTKRILYF